MDEKLVFGRNHATPMIHQDEAAECGLACLAMVAGYHGYDVDLLSLRARHGASIKGMTLTTLLRTAEKLGLDSRPVRADLDHFGELSLPVILHWSFNHFVVLTRVSGKGDRRRYRINDPATGQRILSREEISNNFTGVIVELSPSIMFRRRRERSKLSLWQMWSRASGMVPAMARILLLSLLIECFALASPFYLQVAIDDVVPAHDLDFINALALGFGLLAILNQVTSYVRNWAIINLSNELTYRMISNLFRHLVRLPVTWFQRRSIGDVLMRFNASQPIADLLSHGLLQGVIDAILTLVTLSLMFVYSPLLTAVAIGALCCYIVLRIAYFSALKTRNISILQAQAREQAILIETIRGITPIRLFGREQDRMRVWQNRKVEVVNATVGMARMQGFFTAANSGIVALENILFVYLAVRMCIADTFTIGMITAFGAYKHQFLDSSLNVVGQIFDYKMLDVQLGRIGDIALTESETLPTLPTPGEAIETIELRDVHFAYAKGDPDILAGINVSLTAGETTVIVGRSGSGKSTLLKLVLGLVTPTEGKVLINGKRLTMATLPSYREQVSCVMQEDLLFAGTLAENIAFFDPDIDQARIEEVAKLAMVHNDIMAMPMAYESLVGDMGSALSGGQKQRVLIARALYRRPRLLVMDEATAHLDRETEAHLNANIKDLGIACVIVAHRPSTIALANRRLEISEGVIAEIERDVRPTKRVY